MDTILVISKEPSLIETLASELPEISFIETTPDTAASFVEKKNIGLILLDDVDIGTLPSGSEAEIVKIQRPARLSDLLYTIRTKLQSKTTPAVIAISDGYMLSCSQRLLSSIDNTQQISLTEKELELLLCLLKNADTPTSRDVLLKEVWGYSDDITTHTLETHIYRLRGKLSQTEGKLDIISSEDGGYSLLYA